MRLNDILKKKKIGEKISMVTCYDFWSAKIINETDIDMILVGDSLAMVMHGEDSTVPADTEIMALHTKAVVRGAPQKFVIADMPFMSTRKGLSETMSNVEQLMKAGASAIKIEGQLGHQELITHIVQSGIPVMGHLGLTPQSVHQLSGYTVQGKTDDAQEAIASQAKKLEEAGCFAVVLECVPSSLAAIVQQNLSIPVIGIGAGPDTDGQVLVLQDLLGMNQSFKPKFLRHYANGFEMVSTALNQFHADVKSGSFPNKEESYS